MTAPAHRDHRLRSDFAEHVPKLFPHAPGAKDWFADPKFAEVAAFRNGTLQGAYFMIAARALGLDCGPMSGFDNAGVDREFFAGTEPSSRTFLCSVGYGDPSGVLFPRSPRLSSTRPARFCERANRQSNDFESREATLF
jgi:3-hydroxypropanoate dehydrogenase